MRERSSVDTVVMVVAVLVLAPIVVEGAVIIGQLAFNGIAHGINNILFKTKMKKEVKKGTVVEIEGEYYEVTFTPEEA